MRKLLLGGVAGVSMLALLQPLAFADEKGADELAVEGLSKLMDALSMFVDAIPQYSTPEILENGDIIIRRKGNSDEDESEEKDMNKPEETST